MQTLRVRERPLRADEEVRSIRMWRTEVVEVVAGDLAQDFWEARVDLGALSLIQLFQPAHEGLIRRWTAGIVHRTKVPALPAHRAGVDGEHVVHHVAVGDRTRAAGIVARHAAERRLRAGRDIDREPKSLRPQRGVQLVEYHAGLDDRAFALDLQNAIEVFRVVEDERRAHRLSALRAA